MIIHKMADVNGMFMRDHAFTLTKLGTAKEQMEKLDEALQCYTTAMQITKELLAASPDDGKLN
ncbi:MAG: tetratricopeptide repeat protein [Christensenellales bacterium]